MFNFYRRSIVVKKYITALAYTSLAGLTIHCNQQNVNYPPIASETNNNNSFTKHSAQLIASSFIFTDDSSTYANNNNNLDENNHGSKNPHTNENNSTYTDLLETVERLKILIEEEQIKSNLETLHFEHEATRSNFLEKLKQSHAEQISFINFLRTITQKLANEKMSVDDYLYSLLQERFSYLTNRDTLISQQLEGSGNFSGVVVLPTSKRLFNELMKDQSYDDEARAFNKRIRAYSVSRFELLNLLIKQSFSKCKIDELTSKTINLLRAAVQLHPILANQHSNLGHPDAAAGPYAILEPLIVGTTDPDEKEDVRHLQELFDTKAIARQIQKFGLRSPCKEALIQYYRSILSFKNPTPRQKEAFEKISRKNDLCCYHAHYIVKPRHVQLMNLGTPKKIIAPMKLEDLEKHKVKVSATDYEMGVWPYPLPYPDFLKVPKATSLIAPSASLIQKNEIGELFQKDQPTTEIRENTIKKSNDRAIGSPSINKIIYHPDVTNIANPKIVLQKEENPNLQLNKHAKKQPSAMQQESKVTSQKTINSKVSDLEDNLNTEKIAEAIKEIKKGIRSKESVLDSYIIPSPIKKFSLLEDWPLPQGLRSFHSQMLKKQYPERILTKNHQGIVDRSFDPKQSTNVSFREMKTVLEATGCSIIASKGGSHREVIGPEKETLFGIFAHGKNQVYGPQYMKYIQTLFLYLGCRPTQGLGHATK